MDIKKWFIIKVSNLFDCCKKCGCSLFECKNCTKREFYRHIDDKTKMKSNMRIIRKRKVIKLQKIIHKEKLIQEVLNIRDD